MKDPIDPAVGMMTGTAAPPRRNGELVFDAPWQGRAFGTAFALVERFGLPWSEFQRHLIAAIAEHPDAPYYDSWVTALERMVIERGHATPAELERAAESVRHAADDE